jgi:hypothetical protein
MRAAVKAQEHAVHAHQLTPPCALPVQAAGFAVLVAGTLIYGRGDDRQAHAHSAKHDDMTQQASKKTARQPTFKFHHTIASHHSRSTAQHRWVNALNSTLAAARLRSGSQHAGNDAT